MDTISYWKSMLYWFEEYCINLEVQFIDNNIVDDKFIMVTVLLKWIQLEISKWLDNNYTVRWISI